ncbi:MAG: PEP-CTERM sorting domain-containing protein [Armatimonadetes bacterium]|nr:PEP-CTERM sorting domain-containing protein [Armatimonadota bacterium]
MRTTKLLSMAAMVTVLAGAASAQLIYGNGPPDQQNGNEMTQWLQAENFNLSGNSTLGWIRFWTIEVPNAAYDGNVDWFVFDNNGGIPGSIVDSGSVSNPSKTFLQSGILGSFDEYVYDLDIADVNLTGSTDYWLGLHINADYGSRRDIYWESGGGNAPTGQESDGGTMNNWSGNGTEHAFELYGPVPEPSSLVALGVLGALMLRRRK